MVAFKDSRSDYHPVPSTDNLSEDARSPVSADYERVFRLGERRGWGWKYPFAVLLFSLVFTLTGFALGRYSHSPTTATGIIQVATEQRSFVYNRTFADPPSNETDAAWGTIFPPHAGFFHDAEIAPQGGSLAAYHQLHCLDGMRHAYWILYDAVERGESVDFDALPDHHTPWHTRHCIDFLRQMLMCNADLTIEYVNPKLNGIVGFGVDHQCTRWEEVMQWTVDRQEEWEREQTGEQVA